MFRDHFIGMLTIRFFWGDPKKYFFGHWPTGRGKIWRYSSITDLERSEKSEILHVSVTLLEGTFPPFDMEDTIFTRFFRLLSFQNCTTFVRSLHSPGEHEKMSQKIYGKIGYENDLSSTKWPLGQNRAVWLEALVPLQSSNPSGCAVCKHEGTDR